MKKFLFIIVLAVGFSGYGQVGVGTSNPDASAQLDVVSTNKGVLIPRINLTGSSDIGTVANPKESLLVYNTATSGDVVPGFYYWNSLKWVALTSGGGITGNVTIADGGTGATTASGALINLGAQSVSNLTTVLGTTTDHYPSESAVKTVIDAEATRATAAEAGLQGAIDLKAATTDVTAEAARATAVEAGLQTAINLKAEITDLTAEATRATTAENGIAANLATETTDRASADLLKEDLVNKSIDVVTDGASDTKYPSVKAVKTYVDTMPSFYSADGTLTGTRTVNQNNNDLIFSAGSGKLIVNGSMLNNGAVLGRVETTTNPGYVLQPDDYIVIYRGSTNAYFDLGESFTGRIITLLNDSDNIFQMTGLGNTGVTTIAGRLSVSYVYDGTDWFALNQ